MWTLRFGNLVGKCSLRAASGQAEAWPGPVAAWPQEWGHCWGIITGGGQEGPVMCCRVPGFPIWCLWTFTRSLWLFGWLVGWVFFLIHNLLDCFVLVFNLFRHAIKAMMLGLNQVMTVGISSYHRLLRMLARISNRKITVGHMQLEVFLKSYTNIKYSRVTVSILWLAQSSLKKEFTSSQECELLKYIF